MSNEWQKHNKDSSHNPSKRETAEELKQLGKKRRRAERRKHSMEIKKLYQNDLEEFE